MVFHISILVGRIPVSYTHLDVYKRQQLDRAYRYSTYCSDIGITFKSRVRPVSYTHLDVYKRQRKICH